MTTAIIYPKSILSPGISFTDVNAFPQKERDNKVRRVMWKKFTDASARRALLNTGTDYLVHSDIGMYWGSTVEGGGQNMVGIILMEIRSLLDNNPIDAPIPNSIWKLPVFLLVANSITPDQVIQLTDLIDVFVSLNGGKPPEYTKVLDPTFSSLGKHYCQHLQSTGKIVMQLTTTHTSKDFLNHVATIFAQAIGVHYRIVLHGKGAEELADEVIKVMYSTDEQLPTVEPPTVEPPTVVCIKKELLKKSGYTDLQNWLEKPNHLYIGRNMEFYVPGAVKSKWANPFSLKKFSLEEALDKYEQFVRSKPELMAALPDLGSKVKGTEGCHGDVLVKLYTEFMQPREPDTVRIGTKHPRGVVGAKNPVVSGFKNIDVTSGSVNKLAGRQVKDDFSPLLIGPVIVNGKKVAENFENYWQYDKSFGFLKKFSWTCSKIILSTSIEIKREC